MKSMDPAGTDAQAKEQRILAAIVFTDVVGFSKLAAQNEARVYTCLQRDMGVITSLCRAHSGQVLNTMGDGMLLCFSSAVDAMSCAMEIQRTFFTQSQSLPANDVLHHRIGVHLGDIIMNGDNVFGDGVNIAARLQAEAKPDGICYSKTVHEVIKGKLKIDAEYMASRQLKNIGKVEIWQVPPIEEARQKAIAALVAAPLDENPAPTGTTGYRALLMIGAIFVLLIAVIVFVRLVPMKALPPVAKSGTVVGDTNAPINKLLHNSSPAHKTPGDNIAGGTDSGPAPTPPAAGATTAELGAKFDSLKRAYAFADIVTFLQGDGKALPDSESQAQTFGDLSEMKEWMDTQVNAATASDPISVTLPVDGTPTQVSVYRDPTGTGYTILTTAGERVLPFNQFGNAGIVALAQAIIAHPITQGQPKAEAWIGEFQQQYPG